MKLSLNWIRDFVEIPENIELSKLVYDLTMSTVEVEEAHRLKDDFGNMVVGVVRDVRPHPDADKLVLCIVDVGDKLPDGTPELREIVCGGLNVAEGMRVAVARPGAKVRWHGEGELVELKKAKVRGVESYGMICASNELGLFDLFPFTDDATIMDISEFDAPAGTCLAEALGLDDVILDIDNKSLTNRPDLWGHHGIAREIAAIYDLPLKSRGTQDSQFSIFNSQLKNDSQFSITIDDSVLCPRYIGVKIENLTTKPAPFEMQRRLWCVGMRPINAIVDITNYIMLETGQPTHAFDADIVQGNICVRRAARGEKLVLLNGEELKLTADDLVIADEKEPIALAGVMGGAKDSILPETKNVILEIACFNALTVRRTSMRFDVRTESASRYEKGIDPQRAELALAASARLFNSVFPDSRIAGFCDNYPNPLQGNEIQVSLRWLEKRLGQTLSSERIIGLLERLGFDVEISGDAMTVLPPSWRSTGDVSLPDDIMEEIARIHGLENFEPAPIISAFEGAVNQPDVDIDRCIREYLAYSCGLNEIFTYPWVSREYIAAALGEAAIGDKCEMLEISAPPSPNERHLRSSLIPGLLKAVLDNLRYYQEFSVFESAQVFFDKDYTSEYDERESLPLQRRHVAAAFVTERDKLSETYRHAKGVIEAMPRAVHMQPLGFERPDEPSAKPHWADEIIWQTITLADNGDAVGSMGLLSQKAALDCGIKNAAVMLFELDIDALKPLPSRENTYRQIPMYQMTKYDVSLLFDLAVKWEQIDAAARGKDGPDNLLRDVAFVEQYKGSQVPTGKKSVTIRLTIGSAKKTLTSTEIESCAAAVIKRLSKKLGAETRS